MERWPWEWLVLHVLGREGDTVWIFMNPSNHARTSWVWKRILTITRCLRLIGSGLGVDQGNHEGCMLLSFVSCDKIPVINKGGKVDLPHSFRGFGSWSFGYTALGLWQDGSSWQRKLLNSRQSDVKWRERGSKVPISFSRPSLQWPNFLLPGSTY